MSEEQQLQVFTDEEAKNLYMVGMNLLNEGRPDVLATVVTEIDKKLVDNSQLELVRLGLLALTKTAWEKRGTDFYKLLHKQKEELLEALKNEELPKRGPTKNLPQRQAFDTIAALVKEAYESIGTNNF